MRSYKKKKNKGIKGIQDKLYNQNMEDVSKKKNSWEFSSGSNKRSKEKSRKNLKSESVKKKLNKEKRSTGNKKEKSYVKLTLTFLLIGSLIFFLFSVIVAAYVFLTGGIFVSSENIDIEITGEKIVSAGDEVNLNIKINNKNNVSLKNSEIVLRFPEGARDPEDISSRIPLKRIEIGELEAGGIIEEDVSFDLFGKEGEKHTFSISFDYNLEGSGAQFSKREEFDIKIKDTPISLDFSGPDKIFVGHKSEFEVKLNSNFNDTREDVTVRIDHPLNFNIIDSSEEIDGGIWKVKDLNPGEEKTLKFTGVFTEPPESEKERTLSVSAGPNEDSVIHVAVSDITVDIDDRPFAFDFFLREKEKISFGNTVEGELFWRNRSNSEIKTAQLKLIFEGEAIESFVGSEAQIVDDHLLWSGEEFSKPQGSTSFYFNTHLSEDIKDRDVDFHILFEAETVNGEKMVMETSEEISLLTAFSANVETDLSQREKNDLKDGDLTSFHITLSAVSGIDGIEDAEISGVLPSFVSIEDVLAQDEQIEFDKDGEFVWKLGEVEGGTGVWKPDRSIKLDVTSDPGRRDESSVIIKELVFTGKDKVKEESLRKTLHSVTVDGFNVLENIYGSGF